MHPVGAARLVHRVEVLQLRLHLGQRVLVQQLAQLGLAEQLAQLGLIDGQRLGPPLGQRRVAVVDVVGDVAEQQRRRERRRDRRIDGHRLDLAVLDPPQRRHQRRHVEHVAQALAVGLEQHRERAESRRDREQIRGALALLPERAAPPGPALRQQQRPAGGFPELRREQRRAAELPQHQLLELRRTPAASTAVSGGVSVSGKRTTNPSSVHIVSTSRPVSARTRSTTAIDHGA